MLLLKLEIEKSSRNSAKAEKRFNKSRSYKTIIIMTNKISK